MKCETGCALAAEVAKHALNSRSVISRDGRVAEADPESPYLVAERKFVEHARGCNSCRLLYYSTALEDDEYISIKEALEALPATEKELQDLISRGKISALMVGKVLKVSRDDVDSLDRKELKGLYLI